jgi:tetratricopeptide (TPR) repeat protein
VKKLTQIFCLLILLQPFAVQAQAPVAAAPPTGGQSAGELLATGEAAYNAGEWQLAVDRFSAFIKDFGSLEGTAGAVAKVKPLLAICQVRLENFGEALTLLDEVLRSADLDPKQRVDLVYFAGVCNLRTGNQEAARKHLGEIFLDPKVERSRRMESLVLGGMSYVMEENWKECITFFKKHTDEIAAFNPEAGARAKILLLHALMKESLWADAAAMARSIHEQMDQTRQVVTFSSQLIELGDRLLEDGKLHESISVLRMVPTAAEIREMQTRQLFDAELEMKSAVAAKNPIRASQVKTALAEMQRELEAFEKISQFDSAARLRMAGAYFQLERTREGALILDQMVRQMEPDPIVESATASLMRAWMSLERYPRAVRTADLYLERFAALAEKPNLADIMFLKAQALEGQFKHQEAADGYHQVAIQFADKPIAAQASFMEAYNILQLENYKQAGTMLDRQLKQLKKTDSVWQHVFFWRAMAYYFDQRWEEARDLLVEYMKAAKEDEAVGQDYLDDASFRIGYSYFSEANYPDAIKTLNEFSTSYPQSEWMGEGLLTLGDSFAAEGDLDDADQTYAKIGIEAPGFHDEGWMKRGNLLKLKKDHQGMKKLFTAFLEKRPDSPRIAEGLHWLGWVAKQQGKVQEARDIYQDAIGRFGNDTVRPGLEEMFIGLQGFYPGEQKTELETLLGDALVKAKASQKKRLATRLGWALSQLHLSNKSKPAELRLQDSQNALIALVPEVDPKETAPRILADVGDALTTSGDSNKATLIYQGLRKWWPRAPERDRAYAGLGFIAAQAGNETDALTSFEKYEKSAIMPKTAPDARGITLVEGELGGKVALARAKLLVQRDPELALNILLAVQKTKSMPAAIRAEAFISAARLHVKKGRPREALPYYEQVYLLFNRFPSLVADAYFERGEALEKLGMPEKAREVYSEIATREDLAAFKPARLSSERAQALGGVIPPRDPAGGLIPPTPAAP